MRTACLAVVFAAIELIAGSCVATPPGIVNHQGRIAVGGVNFDSLGHFKFALVEGDPALSTLWTNDGSSPPSAGGEPAAAVEVQVVRGQYAVPLGDTSFHSSMNTPIPASVFADYSDVRLRIWFSEGGAPGSFEQLSPDRRLVAAAYAMNAGGIGARGIQVTESGSIAIGFTDPGETPLSEVLIREDCEAGLDTPLMIAVQGSVACVGHRGADRLLLFDISQTGELSPIGSGATGGFLPSAVALSGDFAYLHRSNSLDIYDVSNPATVSLAGSHPVTNANARRTATDGTTYFYARFSESTIKVVDVSNPAAPSDLPALTVTGEVNALVVHGDLLLVLSRSSATGQQVFTVFDIATPATISETDSESVTGPFGSLAASGDLAFVFQTGSVRVWDISTPSDIQLRAQPSVGQAIGNLTLSSAAIANGRAFVSSFDSNQLAVLDVSDVDNISILATRSGLDAPVAVGAAGDVGVVVERGDFGAGNGKLSSVKFADVALAIDGAVVTASGGLIFPDGTVQTTSAAVGGPLDHGVLSGLGDDDHPQYLLANGARALDGDLSTGGNRITDLGSAGSAGDALPYGQAASGDLGGTLPDPEVIALRGRPLGGAAPQTGQVLFWSGSQWTPGFPGAPDHGALQGLGDDDHSQYLERDGSDQMTGKLDLGGNDIIDARQAAIGGPTADTFLHVSGRSLTGEQVKIEGDENSGATGTGGGILLSGHDGNRSTDWAFIRGHKENSFRANQESYLSFGTRNDRGDLRETMRLDDLGNLQIDGTLTQSSDRDLKTDIEQVDPQYVLDRVLSLPLARWRYRHDDVTHLGPMAQDFREAFGLGRDERHIATVDADGVALAAIQGLNAKLEAENAGLRERLSKLEALVESLTDRGEGR